MAQQTNDVRERLLATLPQPEQLAAYREQTATLLAKHQRALNFDALTSKVLYYCTIGGWFLLNWVWRHQPNFDPNAVRVLELVDAVLLLAAISTDIHYRIYKSQVATLKEIKQVQLQVLELQAWSRRNDCSPSLPTAAG
jgi:hypothetical protein